jgi:hypothetical protein
MADCRIFFLQNHYFRGAKNLAVIDKPLRLHFKDKFHRTLLPELPLVAAAADTIEEQVYREDATGNAVVARARRWRTQVNGRKNNNKSQQPSRAEFTRRPRASKRSILEGYTQA